MGMGQITLFDGDHVSKENIPNQFFKTNQIGLSKVAATAFNIGDFGDTKCLALEEQFYHSSPLEPIVIVATDSMSSRRTVWEQFKKQKQCLTYIEARMGAELGQVYTIVKNPKMTKSSTGGIRNEDISFYEKRLYSDDKVKQLPCTAKVIIYNVLMLSSLICRSVKGAINGETMPREITMSLTQVNAVSWMVRE